jgi:NAD(P)-dependent dehydrogenase (short-subunit alcohol dehydrogenase family)
VVQRFGRLDILVNNAAVAFQGKTLDAPGIDNAQLDRMWTINVAGVIANIRAAAKVLPGQCCARGTCHSTGFNGQFSSRLARGPKGIWGAAHWRRRLV